VNTPEFSPLQSEIKKLIKSSGAMPVWRYMELCLLHPDHGYYVSRDPLGREGDFTTAPEVSQMFGELLGLWAASIWKTLGSPSLLRLIELGPGRGTMIADALRAMRVLPPLYQTLSVHLVEINPVLRKKQQETLSGIRNVAWHDRIEQVPDGVSIILANYVAGRKAEYHKWYDEVHSIEVINVPGHVAMKRGELSSLQVEPSHYCPGNQLVMCAQQTDDLMFTIKDFSARAGGRSPSGVAMQPRSSSGSTARTVHYFKKISGNRLWTKGIAYGGDLSVYPGKTNEDRA